MMDISKRSPFAWLAALLLPAALPAFLAGCGDDAGSSMDAGSQMPDATPDAMADAMPDATADASGPTVRDPATAEKVAVDRFSESAGTLFVRTADNGLPGPNEAIDFDQAPFLSRGLGPNGEVIRYYNLDVQRVLPPSIYVLYREGEDTPVEGQLDIVGVMPGDPSYSDFWCINKVTVPADYVANTVTSEAEIKDGGFPVQVTGIVVNCPVVPEGSSAVLRGGTESPGLHQGWYDGKVFHYFSFDEAALKVDSAGRVPFAPVYVTVNKNPDAADATSGLPSGFVTEDGTDKTHNVVSALPGDTGYTPLGSVQIYDNQDFADVSNLATVQDDTLVTILETDVALVNWPVVEVVQ